MSSRTMEVCKDQALGLIEDIAADDQTPFAQRIKMLTDIADAASDLIDELEEEHESDSEEEEDDE